ncbi:MAG: SDR family oxidoreductase [Pseudomonadota bacterium]
MENSEGSIALVTGASRGLGYAVAAELAAAGAHVVAVARTVGGLEELADAVEAQNGAITLVPLDITDDGGVQRMCAALFERWGRVDVWVHAAIQDAPLSPASAISPKDIEKALATNVAATVRLIRMVAPLLQMSDSGTAVYFEDDKAGHSFYGAYGATKAAQSALFKSWQTETQRIAPNVIGFAPQPMPTALRARFYPGEGREGLSHPEAEAKRLLQAANLLQKPEV